MPAIQDVLHKFVNCNIYGLHLWTRRFNTSIFNATPKRTVEEKLGIPRRPKKPPTAFISFVSERRPALMQQNPNQKQPALLKILSEEWKNLEKSKKEEFQERFKNDWSKYLEESKNYDQRLSPGEKERIEIEKEEAKILQAKKKLKKKRMELGCPKKPGSSYMYYMRTRLPDRGDVSFMDFQKKLKIEWEELPASEKQKFDKMYQKDMEDYREKMAEWNKQMLARGIRDVVLKNSSKLSSHVGHTMISSMKEPDTELNRIENRIESNIKFRNEFSNIKIAYVLIIGSLAVISFYVGLFIFTD